MPNENAVVAQPSETEPNNPSQLYINALTKSFGTEFQVLSMDEVVDGSVSGLDIVQRFGSCNEDVSLLSDQVLQTVFRASQSGVTQTFECCESGRTLVATPFEDELGRAMLAVGMPEIDPIRLTVSLAKQCVEGVSNSERMADHVAHIQLFAEQVTNSMEELTWLRSLATHLRLSRKDNQLEDVVEHTFETLCSAIQAEALLLIRPKRPGFSLEMRRRENLYVAVWTGCRDYRDEECTLLAEEILSRLGDRPYVWNRQSTVRNASAISVDERFHSCVLVPVRSNAQDYGWILAINKIPPLAHYSVGAGESPETLGLNEFGTIEASLLESASGMLATHAANVSLFAEQQHLTVSIIRSLIKVVDARDRYTCGHSDRVAVMARELARCIGFERSDIESICLAGLLHDIGKVGVPDDILLKPGRLTREEFDVIKEHPERGVEILKHIQQLHHILPGVLHHHEAFDGSGYPDGISGSDIPEMARVIAVVDAYDAITTSRPYREARSHEEAIAILKSGAGKGWDPAFVQAFIQNVDKIVSHAKEWEDHITRVLDPAVSAFDALSDAGAYS